MLHYIDMAEGAFIAALALFGYLAVKNGGGWALTKIKGWWNTAKVDVIALEARVTALEQKTATPAPAPAPTTPA